MRPAPPLCQYGGASCLNERVPIPDTRVDTTWRITLLVSVTRHHRHCRVFVMYCELSPQKNLHLWQVPGHSKHRIILAVPVVECR